MAAPMHPADAVYHDGSRKDRRSPLKRVLDKMDQSDLQNVIACPYGCKAGDQDRMGYCRHLIGFVNSETLKDGEVKNPPEGAVVELVAKEPDEHNRRPIVGRGKLQKGDHLLRITSSLRVYRQVDENDVTTENHEIEYVGHSKPTGKVKPRQKRGKTVLKASTQREEPSSTLTIEEEALM